MNLFQLKTIIIVFFVFVFLAVVALYSYFHTMNKHTLGEVEPLTSSLALGDIRANAEDPSVPTYSMVNKEELVNNMIAKVAAVQKSANVTLKVSYNFYDEAGQLTEDETEFRSIQMKVEYVDKNGKVLSVSEKRMSIDELTN